MAGEAKIDPQVAMRAALPKEAAAKATPAPGETRLPGQVEKLADEAREALQKASAESSPAQTLKEVLDRSNKGTKEAADEAIEANIGTEIDPDSHIKVIVASTPEEARKTEAVKWDDRNRELIDAKGKVTPADLKPGGKYEYIRMGLDQIIDASPLSHVADSAVREAMYEAMLQDPEFLQEMAQGNADNLAKRLPGAQELIDAKRKAAEALAKFTAAKNRYDDADREVGRLKGREKALDPTTGTDYAKLKALEARPLGQELADATYELKQEQKAWEDLIKAKRGASPPADIDTQIANAKASRDAAKLKEDGVRADIATKENLQREIRELPNALREANREMTAATEEYNSANAQKIAADSAHSSAVLQRTKAESDWVAEKKNLARDAMQRVLDKRMQSAAEADKARLDKDAAEKSDLKDKKLIENRANRYFKIGKDGRIEVDKVTPKEDMAKILTMDKDADGRTGIEQLVATELNDAGYTKDEIAEKMKDSEFVNQRTSELAQQVLTAFIQSGGKLRSSESAFMEAQPWGQKIIERALATSDPVKKADEALKAAGIHEGIRKFANKGMLAAILAILAGGALGIFAAGQMTGVGHL